MLFVGKTTVSMCPKSASMVYASLTVRSVVAATCVNMKKDVAVAGSVKVANFVNTIGISMTV